MAYSILQFIFKDSEDNSAIIIGNKKLIAALAVIVVVFGVFTINRNADWKDDYTLDAADSKKFPQNFRLHYFAGRDDIKKIKENGQGANGNEQYYSDAIAHFEKSLAIYPGFINAHLELANIFLALGQVDSAEFHDEKALSINPANSAAINSLANIYKQKKRYAELIRLLKKASIYYPENKNYILYIGSFYMQLMH